MAFLEKLESEVFPKAVKQGKFGEDVEKFIRFINDTKFKPEDQFCSSVYFGDVILETNKGDKITHSVVIKTHPDDPDSDAEKDNPWDAKLMFYNEFLFYDEILPLLSICDSTGEITKKFPKFVYGSAIMNGATDDVLIFDNVQKLGYKLAKSRAFLDYNHIKLTLEWIGKFHSLSLVCKRKFPGKFEEISRKIGETTWTEEKTLGDWNKFLVENCKRGVLPLLSDKNYKNNLTDLLDVIEKAGISSAKIVFPVEPLAVICHGDFCRNNIFYKYDLEGVPYDIIFFDLATIRYSSPVIDLSFFLFTNVSPEVRSSHWDDILKTYHVALTSSSDLDPNGVPSLDDVTKDFQRRGFYGYAISAFWLPEMLVKRETEAEDEWWKQSVDEQIKNSLSTGGEEATGYVVEMVKHMIDKKFDFEYIKNLELKFLKKIEK